MGMRCVFAREREREKGTYIRHLITVLPIGTHAPHHQTDSHHDGAEDGRVLLPVRRLRVPTSCGRPYVLGVSIFLREGSSLG